MIIKVIEYTSYITMFIFVQITKNNINHRINLLLKNIKGII